MIEMRKTTGATIGGKHDLSMALWFLPIVVMLGLFLVVPILDVIRLSFTTASIVEPEYSYTLHSFIRVLEDQDIHWSFIVTAIFVSANAVFQIALGLVIALAVHAGQQRKVFGTTLSRTAVLTAWIIPGVLVGIVWNMLLSSGSMGIVNHFVEQLGLERIPFLYNPLYAVISIIVADIWRGTAFSMILQYAGLQRIAPELYEVARVDGANGWQQFARITVPHLKPIAFINLVLVTIYSFNTFDMIFALTRGGPARTTEVLTLAAYKQVFLFWDMGRGAAIAVVLLVATLVMTLVYYKMFQLDEEVTE